MSYTYVNEDDIDLELICIICYQPFQSPVNCIKCGQTLCHKCSETWKQRLSATCPTCREYGSIFVPVITRVVLNQLNRLPVQCSLCQQTNIQRYNFSDHLSCTCPMQTIKCPNRCGWKGYRKDFEEHSLQCQSKGSSWFRYLRRWNIFW